MKAIKNIYRAAVYEILVYTHSAVESFRKKIEKIENRLDDLVDKYWDKK